jgi:hypothetical protein
MVNISLTPYTKVFFGSFLKSPTQMGSLSKNNLVTNISRLGTFKDALIVQELRVRLEESKKQLLDTEKYKKKLGKNRIQSLTISQQMHHVICSIIVLCVLFE